MSPSLSQQEEVCGSRLGVPRWVPISVPSPRVSCILTSVCWPGKGGKLHRAWRCARLRAPTASQDLISEPLNVTLYGKSLGRRHEAGYFEMRRVYPRLSSEP